MGTRSVTRVFDKNINFKALLSNIVVYDGKPEGFKEFFDNYEYD